MLWFPVELRKENILTDNIQSVKIWILFSDFSIRKSTSTMHTEGTIHLALVGDSDIARWPKDLWPCAAENDDTVEWPCAIHQPTHVSGVSGATLSEIRPLVHEALRVCATSPSIPSEDNSILVIVLCAGENDLSTPHLTLNDTLAAFQTLVQEIQEHSSSSSAATIPHIHVIFLGPKLEPWLDYDKDARKDYLRLSQRLEQACSAETVQSSFSMEFVNCLLMFCDPESAKQKGALWGGRAKAERKYFDHDELHLSRQGYRVWKQVVEESIQQFCSRYYTATER